MSVANAVVVVGNPAMGLTLYGPFESYEEAVAHADGMDADWYVTELLAPGKLRQDHCG